MTFRAPVNDILFTLDKIIGWDRLAGTAAFPDFTPEIGAAILEEAAKFAENTLAPLDRAGDRERLRFDNGAVTTPAGFRQAYAQFVAGGWMGLSGAAEFGGQGLPHVLGAAVYEMTSAANMAFMLCPILGQGGIEALTAHGTPELKARFLPKMMSGTWTATMNLTEPQAGSDVGALRTKAERRSDGSYRITGSKIFITWGEHDMAENIVHLVLARLPDAPPGTRGISLFLVPKYIPDANGNPGARNGVECASIEHKIGIHASPTCVMQYGEHAPTVGWLIGEENRGMACMFTMMNAARLAVALEGVGAGARACHQAFAFAQERRQGRRPGTSGEASAPIAEHPDVARTLATMRVTLTAMRALCYDTALSLDLAHAATDAGERAKAAARAGLLTPLAKAWSTDQGVELASLNIQIHGGMGYIEETGAAQVWRDARIAPIYEGTNGIQAIDLVTRKIVADNGVAVEAFLDEIAATAAAVLGADDETHACCGHDHGHHHDHDMPDEDPLLAPVASALRDALTGLSTVTAWMQTRVKEQPDDALAGAAPYLQLFAIVAGGHYLLRAAIAAKDDPAQRDLRVNDARFYAFHVLARAFGLALTAMAGADTAKNMIEALRK